MTYQPWTNERKKHVLSVMFSLFHVRKSTFFVRKQPGMKRFIEAFCKEHFDLPLCLTKENNKNMSHVDVHSSYKEQDTRECTMLLLDNLATPEWLHTNSFLKLLPHLVFVQYHYLKPEPSTQHPVDSHICRPLHVFFDNHCLIFATFKVERKQNISDVLSSKTNRKLLTFSRSEPQNTSHILETAVQASSLETGNFVFKTRNQWKTILYNKVWTKYKFSEAALFQNTNITLVGSSKAKNQTVTCSLLHICNENEYVSTAYVCDNNHKCISNTSFSQKCWSCTGGGEVLERSTIHCLPLFFLSRTHRCESFVSKAVFKKHMVEASTTKSLLYEIPRLPMISLDHKTVQIAVHTVNCDISGTNTHSYRLSEVCVYRVDHNFIIVPCKAGSHLQDCKGFDCSLHFKCPNYYCVPWGYICNGRWDCPDGYDEHKNLKCSKRSCKDMFKCTKYSICAHLNDVCDGYTDCPSGDDEILCDLMYTVCPSSCNCLNYAILCQHLSLPTFKNLKYISFHITFSKVNLLALLNHFQNNEVLFLNLSFNALKYLHSHNFAENHLFLVDYSSNKVTEVERNCFADMHKISHIILKNNSLRQLHTFAMNNISSSFSLDLSQNNISTLTKNCMFNVKSITKLLLSDNPINLFFERHTIGVQTVHLVMADHFRVCCFQPATRCWAKISESCKDLLPTQHLKIVLPFVSLSVCLLNNISIALNIWKKIQHSRSSNMVNKRNTNTAYNIVIFTIHMVDTLCGVYLLIIWSADLTFKKHYVVKEPVWRKSTLCLTSFATMTMHCLCTPLLFDFLSLARYDVVKEPFNSKFKSKNIVIKCLVVVFIFVISVTVAFVTIFSHFCEIATGLCLPFIHKDATCFLFHIGFVFVISLYQSLAIFIFLFLYVAMCFRLKQPASSVSSHRKVSKSILIQIFFLGVLSTASWTSNLVYMASIFQQKPSEELLVWATGLLLPLNPLFNPVIVIVLLLRKK